LTPDTGSLDIVVNFLGSTIPGVEDTCSYRLHNVRVASIRSLNVYVARDRMERVAALPQLARLERLNLHGNALTAADVAYLASSPFVSGLKELILSWNEIGAEGARTLAASPHLGRLVVLDLVQSIPIHAVGLLADRFGRTVRIAVD
jgi:hypothetical protein